MGHQVSLTCPKNMTLLEFFRVILVHSKSFFSTFYQLTDSTPKKDRPICDRICPVRDAVFAEVLVESKKYFVNIKRTLNNHFKHKNKKVTL